MDRLGMDRLGMDRLAPSAERIDDWIIPQAWDRYTADEHATWAALYARQHELLQGRACGEFLSGVAAMQTPASTIPDFAQINASLQPMTGWKVVAVEGLVPDTVFFDMLVERTFPVGRFIRRPDQLDYIEEPDIFHDFFGHVPMLTNPQFADFMVAYGEAGHRAAQAGRLHELARLYWYTVEFGLVQTPDGLRIYGAGIASSPGESVFALEDASPNRLGLDIARVARTPYRIDDMQQVYFVIGSIAELLRLKDVDFGLKAPAAPKGQDIPIDAVLPSDRVFTRGVQSYARSGGRRAVQP